MNILVLGAAGQTGRHVVDQAAAAGHRVTALARDTSKLTARAENIVPFAADAGDATALRRALEGQDAVICAMGNPTPRQRNPALVSAIERLVSLMEQSDPRRLIYLSTILVPESRARAGRIAATLAPLIIANDIADHVEKERAVVSSKTDWTLIRATKLSNAAPTGRYLTGTDVSATKSLGMVPRADLASFMMKVLVDNTYLREKPVIVI